MEGFTIFLHYMQLASCSEVENSMSLQTNTQQKSYRLQVRFWLDVFRDEEYELAQYVDDLKQKRSFSATVRDALNLIRDLKNGKVETLLRLFPWVEDYFKSKLIDDPLREQIKQLTALVQTGLPAPERRSLPAPPPAEPELVIKQAAPSQDVNPNANLRIQAAQMLGDAYHILTASDIEYGIRTGRIPATFARPSTPPPGNPKKMDVPQFAAPSPDDFDIEL